MFGMFVLTYLKLRLPPFSLPISIAYPQHPHSHQALPCVPMLLAACARLVGYPRIVEPKASSGMLTPVFITSYASSCYNRFVKPPQ